MSLSEVRVVTGYDRALVGQLVDLQRQAFPPRMQIDGPERYYAEGLSDPANINLVMSAADGKVTGYMLAIPQSRVFEELRPWDPAMQEGPGQMYVDMVQTLSGRRQFDGFLRLARAMCAECDRRGVSRLSMHVRASTGLSRVIQRILAESRCLRRLENWYGFGEPFDYIEAEARLTLGR